MMSNKPKTRTTTHVTNNVSGHEEQHADNTTTEAELSEHRLLTDGGATCPSYADARKNLEIIRESESDGKVMVVRDGDEHIIYKRLSEHTTSERVPAERTAVLPGETLWAKPDNWNERLTIDGAALVWHTVFEIPETGLDVAVSFSKKNTTKDDSFNVNSVGEAVVEPELTYDKSKLDSYLAKDKAESTEVKAALHYLADSWEEFIEMHEEEVAQYADSRFWRVCEGARALNGWTIDNWIDTFDIWDILRSFADIDSDTAREVNKILLYSMIPAYPDITLSVEHGVGLTVTHALQALTEAGCDAAEVIDYAMVEFKGISASRWATLRGVEESTVAKNIETAEWAMS